MIQKLIRVVTNFKPKVKWVKKANMWCVTEFIDNKQVQTWHRTKEEANEKKT